MENIGTTEWLVTYKPECYSETDNNNTYFHSCKGLKGNKHCRNCAGGSFWKRNGNTKGTVWE